MIQSATGVILRVRPLTETSLIVQWLTPEFGRISTVAKGARRPKSPFAGKLDLFYLADFNFSRSRRSELHTLREVSLRETHSALRNDLGRLQQASYCAALVTQTTETETPLPSVYEMMRGLLAHLAEYPPQPQTIFAFELKLLKELGLSPDLSDRKFSTGTKRLLAELGQMDWPVLSRLKLSPAQAHDIQQFLHGFLIYHLERIPGGRSAALADDSRNTR
jgi:DNA repair protein RecO (recombination protein O)